MSMVLMPIPVRSAARWPAHCRSLGSSLARLGRARGSPSSETTTAITRVIELPETAASQHDDADHDGQHDVQRDGAVDLGRAADQPDRRRTAAPKPNSDAGDQHGPSSSARSPPGAGLLGRSPTGRPRPGAARLTSSSPSASRIRRSWASTCSAKLRHRPVLGVQHVDGQRSGLGVRVDDQAAGHQRHRQRGQRLQQVGVGCQLHRGDLGTAATAAGSPASRPGCSPPPRPRGSVPPAPGSATGADRTGTPWWATGTAAGSAR